ncbi:MAG: DNA mismatch repair endonuclease MutL [Anaerovoracaceae bacterium]|jgi:DNA mismatch repair protein MutL
MKKINKLDKATADKIAAGEVVDRPFSIVKELMENAIDGEAKTITVEIKNGGKTYIRVTDDGHGIMGDDMEMAFQRHATSKIRAADDLSSIRTLGFRGEALAGISAVSKVECISKTPFDKTGNRIYIEGGNVMEKQVVGCPDGTTFIIKELFFNTPARRKFLKNDGTEASYIIDYVSRMALAYPEIKIRLINDGNTLFFTSGTGDVYTNILIIHGKEIGDLLINVEESMGDLSLSAYISPPHSGSKGRRKQIFFVNGRSINSRLIEKAVTHAYREKIADGKHPIVFLFIKDDPKGMDVNIHPTKQEIRFDDEDRVFNFLSQALRNGLYSGEALPNIRIADPFAVSFDKRGETTYLEETTDNNQIDVKGLFADLREKETPYEAKEDLKAKHDFSPKDISIIGSIFNTYLAGMDETHFYLIDQHAAHERIFYEQSTSKAEAKDSQILLTAYMVEVPLSVAAQSESWLPIIRDMGYDIEIFGPKTYIIKAIPNFMELNESKDFLDYFLNHIDEGDVKNPLRIDKLIMNACKSAVKAGDSLSHAEMVRLMEDLSMTENPFSCPHGRPIFLRLSKTEIERMFKRR